MNTNQEESHFTDVRITSTEDLEAEGNQLVIDIANIKLQLSNAKSEAVINNTFADTKWFNNAKHALRMKGIAHQNIIKELAKRRKQNKKKEKKVLDHYVHMAARRLLAENLYEEILETAQQWMIESNEYKILFLLFIANLAIAEELVLNPINGFLGKIPFITVCDFRYKSNTFLAPGTKLKTSPFSEEYGEGSKINREDGMTCSDCFVSSLEMSSTGVITLKCDTFHKYLNSELKF